MAALVHVFPRVVCAAAVSQLRARRYFAAPGKQCGNAPSLVRATRPAVHSRHARGGGALPPANAHARARPRGPAWAPRALRAMSRAAPVLLPVIVLSLCSVGRVRAAGDRPRGDALHPQWWPLVVKSDRAPGDGAAARDGAAAQGGAAAPEGAAERGYDEPGPRDELLEREAAERNAALVHSSVALGYVVVIGVFGILAACVGCADERFAAVVCSCAGERVRCLRLRCLFECRCCDVYAAFSRVCEALLARWDRARGVPFDDYRQHAQDVEWRRGSRVWQFLERHAGGGPGKENGGGEETCGGPWEQKELACDGQPHAVGGDSGRPRAVVLWPGGGAAIEELFAPLCEHLHKRGYDVRRHAFPRTGGAVLDAAVAGAALVVLCWHINRGRFWCGFENKYPPVLLAHLRRLMTGRRPDRCPAQSAAHAEAGPLLQLAVLEPRSSALKVQLLSADDGVLLAFDGHLLVRQQGVTERMQRDQAQPASEPHATVREGSPGIIV